VFMLVTCYMYVSGQEVNILSKPKKERRELLSSMQGTKLQTLGGRSEDSVCLLDIYLAYCISNRITVTNMNMNT